MKARINLFPNVTDRGHLNKTKSMHEEMKFLIKYNEQDKYQDQLQ